jgi:hypothetical protein
LVRLVVLAQDVVALEQLVASQQQLGKIDHSFFLALLFVGRVELDRAPGELVHGVHVMRAPAFLLGSADEVLDFARREAVLVGVEPLQQPLDRGELVLRVEYLEQLRQVRFAVMGSQQAVAQPVERPDPRAAHVDGQHRRDARQHLPGGLVGERHCEQPAGACVAGLDQPGDPGGENSRLARPGARQDEGVLVGQGDGGELFGIEMLEKRGHAILRGICAADFTASSR